MTDFRPVLRRFAPLAEPGLPPRPADTLSVVPMSGGLINDTFALGTGFVLQRLHRIFRAEVNLDIAALTPHLLAADVLVPTLLPAHDGRPWTEVDPAESPELAGVWRILTRLPGLTRERAADPAQAQSAGQIVARFHGALAQVQHTFHFTRPGAHNTDLHMQRLQEALAELRDHRLHDAVAPLAEELLARWQAWGRPPQLPSRIVHGDLKVSNLLFTGSNATAVLDLDTMAHGTLDIELGDALRSWCNTGREDDETPQFDSAIFVAAMQGYVSHAGDWLTGPEVASLAAGLERLCIELSARFAADALREAYFGWNPQRAATRGDHNLMRARNQLGLGREVARERRRLEAQLAALWSAHEKG